MSHCWACEKPTECETVDLTMLYCDVCEAMVKEDAVSPDDLECIAHMVAASVSEPGSSGTPTSS